jgi:GNAT superfamily N-acetyltransferase
MIGSLFKYRKASSSDTSIITLLAEQLGDPALSEVINVRLDLIFNHNEQILLVAEEVNAGVIGWIHAFRSLRVIVDPFIEVGGLIIEANYRGLGIGRDLLMRVED